VTNNSGGLLMSALRIHVDRRLDLDMFEIRWTELSPPLSAIAARLDSTVNRIARYQNHWQ
jgi:hypothetical protein